MPIRTVILSDYPFISNLLAALGYPDTNGFVVKKLERIIDHASAAVYVYEMNSHIVGFIAIDIALQIGLEGDILRINYLAVDPKYRNQGIGKELEEYVNAIAVQKNCDRIEVHCHERRTQAHAFYERQGYTESPKYFIKAIAIHTNGR